MEFASDSCYQALLARDRRFDGLFFVGVSTTRIYCRPVCPARPAGRDRCTFFPSAAAAERDGYRPCLRCRPELAPGQAPMDTEKTIVPGIVARIQAGALNDGASVETLAAEFGLTSRHVRRLLRAAMGISPVQLAQTCRLLLAKQLLTETRLSITEVAFASGFASLRRFNHSFRSHYRLTPSRLRQRNSAKNPGRSLRLRLGYRPPFDWAKLLSFLEARAIARVEHVEDRAYLRTVAFGDHRGWLKVRQSQRENVLTVEVTTSLTPILQSVLARLRDLFDLHARPDVIDTHLAQSDRLAEFVHRHPGLRVPGAFSGFELAWRAILGQQVSVRGASTLAGRFAAAYGEPVDTPLASLNLASPTAERVAASTPARIATIGVPMKRAETLHSLARLLVDTPTLLDPGPSIDPTVDRLCTLPGIGPWTAAYIAQRALRWPDAFPESDLGLKHALQERSAARIRKIAEPWRPWRSYAAMHLWMSLVDEESNP